MSTFQTIFLIATAVPSAPYGMQPGHEIAGTASRPVRTDFRIEAPKQLSYGSDASQAFSFAPVSASMEALQKLREFASWTDNWDGLGAAAPQAAVVDAATNLLGMIDDLIYSTPSVALNAHGEPTFMILDDAHEVSITLVSPGTVHYYVSAGEFEDGGSARFNGQRMPSKLAGALKRAGLTYA